MAFEAKFSKTLPKGRVQCIACNHYCVLANNEFGKCIVRQNQEGKLISLVYGKTQTLTIDPIEKKPLFHFKPKSKCLTVSTLGCNFKCDFCQNFEMSQQFSAENLEGRFGIVSPGQIVEACLKNKVQGIAYSYNEPTVFAEYALETMKLARKKGLYNVWVSNGFMTETVLEAIVPFLDAINVDLKGSKEFYQKVCGSIGQKKVLQNIEWLSKSKVHLELTYLIVPTFNDDKKHFQEAADFVLGLSDKIPLHFSAFHPEFKLLHLPPTPQSKVKEAQAIAEKTGLKYVYSGNLGLEENSKCPNCRNLLIRRKSYVAEVLGFKAGECKNCGIDLSKDFKL
ncbi:MAG: AmmeMemoRadiSam system radical SAM enzyme [Candidatus Diapherotrites archaeon]|nr:AmmeMemoRadiSam system radical SAM enzyme [Candidatus Diapherotrites archaeon]